jgi:large subunit ribosomal protein L15e
MGAYKYLQEIYRKKQSDVMRFIFRIRTWHYRQLAAIHRAPKSTRPEKARRVGYKAKAGYVNKKTSIVFDLLNINTFRLSIVYEFDVVHERNQYQKVKSMANQNIKVLIN